VRFAVLGDPVDHSLSPTIHGAAFRSAGIDATYVARTVDASGLIEAVAEIRYGTLTGANVTMPHKELAFEQAELPSETALRTGAVNTLSRSGGRVRGDNTDVEGVAVAWAWNHLPESGPVLVLGAGGAAAAVAVALAGRDLHLSARRPAFADALARRVRVRATSVPWGEGVVGAVIVNATPLGMRGEALPPQVLAEAGGLFDMAYAAGTTPAMAEIAARGLPVAPGTDMLLAQAAASFRLWTGVEAPHHAMRSALEAEVRRREAEPR
jgi:shikimate dehydrogenase